MAWSTTIEGVASHSVDINGVRTHYLEAGSGQPLLLLHGGGAGADSFGNWRGCLPTLARRAHVYAVDLLGFGRSAKPDPATYTYTQSGRVDQIIGFIEALGLREVTLIGNSMGGITSIGVAIERPDLVDRVVLMGSAGVRFAPSPELQSIMNYDFSIEGMRRIVEGLTHPRFAVDQDMVEYRYRLSIEPDTRAAYAAIMGWLGQQGGLFYDEDYIRRLRKRALVMHGKLDKVVPLACSYRLLELIDDSFGYIVPNCGHWAMIEHPRAFTAAVFNFLDT